MYKVTRQPWPGYEYQGETVTYWNTFAEAAEACGGGTPDLVKRGVWESGDDEAHYEVIWEHNPNYPGQTAQQIADHKMDGDL